MEKGEKFQREKIETGKLGYLNENCWLVKNLNYAPYKRCQYCELKFRNCLFLHYQIVSLVLILFFLTLSFLIEGDNSKLVIISVFTLVIVYGYFFNKSTDKIIQAYFAQRKAKEALEELAKGLEGQVKQRTKELRKAYEELKVLDKSKSEFISIASHQLRTPLTAIKGYISMVLEKTYGEPPEKMEKPLENIYASNERLIRLVNDLLNVSRIEMGRIEMNFEKKALDEIITSVMEELKGAADKKSIYLKFEKPEKALPKITVDRDKIRQVIINIIDNAIRYTEKGGVTIKINPPTGGQISPKQSLRDATGQANIQIIITDTGEGMTKEEISHLFESFSRGRAGTRFWTEGAGLGLYIAKKFIDMHKGRIFAESKGKDKGSTFYIEIPIK